MARCAAEADRQPFPENRISEAKRNGRVRESERRAIFLVRNKIGTLRGIRSSGQSLSHWVRGHPVRCGPTGPLSRI
jgi:hypothetical protein